jgi:nitroreductase
MSETGQAVLDAIRSRRSIRQYSDDPVSDDDVRAILEAGRWAPSGLNNQPWRFGVVRDPECKNAISELTRYRQIIRNAPVIIAVFLDNDAGYDRVKDCQSIGACLQNMWLATHTLGLGGVWLGEILKNFRSWTSETSAAAIPAERAIRTHLQRIMKRESDSKGFGDGVSQGGSLQRSKEGRI